MMAPSRPALSIYKRTAKGAATRDIALILSQHRLCMDNGARGSNYFSLHYLSDPLVEAFRTGPYGEATEAYRPPAPLQSLAIPRTIGSGFRKPGSWTPPRRPATAARAGQQTPHRPWQAGHPAPRPAAPVPERTHP